MNRLVIIVCLLVVFGGFSVARAEDTPQNFSNEFVYYSLPRPIPFTEEGQTFTLNNLAIADSRVMMRKADSDFSAGFLPFLATKKNVFYEVRMGYSMFSVVAVAIEVEENVVVIRSAPTPGSKMVFVDVGVEIYGQALVSSKDEGISLSDYKGLALGAKKNDISGTLALRCVGITGVAATVLVPTGNLSLDETSVTVVLNAMSAIKGTLFNKDTRINPCILGFQTEANAGQVYRAMPQIIEYLKNHYTLEEGGFVKSAPSSGAASDQ